MEKVYWNTGAYIDVCVNNSVRAGYKASEEAAALAHARRLRDRVGPDCVTVYRVVDGERAYFDFDGDKFVAY